MKFTIRKLREEDIEPCIALFQDTVHHVNNKDYSFEELQAWAPIVKPNYVDNLSYWKTLKDNISYIAEYNSQIIGFADLNYEGYLDRLFVHKNYQRQGVASLLMSKLEDEALKLGIKRITTEASIT